MGMLRKSTTYDRSHILDAAARARSKKKRVRAIELYRWVLAVEPQNGELHAKLAPLLAETGQNFDAWCSFKATARIHLREGQTDKALAVYREASLYLPREVQAWLSVARLEHKRGHERDAMETLLEASRNFRTRWLRPQAVHLLRHARELAPWDFEVVLELALLLASTQQRHEARLLLSGLAERTGGDRLRRVRAAQLRVAPSPRTALRWLQAWLRPEPEPPAAPGRERTPVRARPSPASRPGDVASGPRLSSSVVPIHSLASRGGRG